MRMDGRQMTYGGPTGKPVPPRRRVPTGRLVLVGLVGVVVVLGMMLLGGQQDDPATTAAQPTPAASASAAADDSLVEARSVAETFVAGYASQDQATREEQVKAVASPDLAQQLITTPPEAVVRPLGELQVSAAPVGATASQPLEGGGRLELELQMASQAEHGWLVVAAREV